MSELIKSISKKEWWLVGLLALLVIIITASPFVYGYIVSVKEDLVFSGIHHYAPGDTNVFLSMIEQVKQGNNVFINLYTSEPQLRAQINPLWLSVGWLAKLFNLPNLLALHIARSLWIMIFCFVAYLFIAYFFQDKIKRKIIIIFILFSSGLGFLFNQILYDQNNIYEHPTDIWVTESITFSTLFHSPHLIASLTLIILTFLLMLMSFEKNKYLYSVLGGFSCLLMLSFHPFNGPTIYGVLGVYLLFLFIKNKKIMWTYLKHFAILCLIPLPAVLYYFLIYEADEIVRNWNAQNILPSPSVWMYLIGYGLLLSLLIFGIWKIVKKYDQKRIFIVLWFFTSAVLLYIPLSFQRRLSEGLHIPIAILAAIGIISILNYISQKRGQNSNLIVGLIIFFSIFLPMTNLQVIGQDFYLFTKSKDNPYYFYMYQGEKEAMNWLRDNLSKEEKVFSSMLTGNFIPAYSGRVVWIGHSPQTADLANKIELQNWFWENDSEIEKKYDLLKSYDLDYLYYGGEEKNLGTFDPATKNYLREVFWNNKVVIYKVL